MIGRFKGRRAAQFAVMAFFAGELSYVAAEVLVLRSVGPSARRYAAGQRLPDNHQFVLRPGDSIAILAGGGTRTFRGPGTFSATGPARAAGLASASQRRTTGAVRGTATAAIARPTDPWAIDTSQSGRACVAANGRPMLWRPVPDRAADLIVTPQSGAAQTVRFAAGQRAAAWPAGIALVDGASYQLNWPSNAAPSRITVRTLPAPAAGDVAGAATALLSRQCRSQLDVLIAVNEAAPAAR